MNAFQKFFANDRTMVVSFIIALICFIGATVFSFNVGLSMVVTNGLQLVFIIVLIWAFVKHEATIMHTVIGASLIVYIISDITAIIGDVSLVSFTGSIGIAYAISIIDAVLFVILFINHLAINSAHKSVNGKILFNQIIIIILAAYQIATMVILLVSGYTDALSAVFIPLAKVFLFAMIVCIESKLNAYKLIREECQANGTWTDEMKENAKKYYFGE